MQKNEEMKKESSKGGQRFEFHWPDTSYHVQKIILIISRTKVRANNDYKPITKR
jgi:hypothetical protein